MDETSFFLMPKGGKIFAERGKNAYVESTRSDKENVTTLFAVNAAGQFAPPLILSSLHGLGDREKSEWVDDI